jgi:hypothetical protein
LLLAGCYYEIESELYPGVCEIPESVSFSIDIEPIILSKCATSGCHEAADPADGIPLTSYQEIKAEADSDRLVGGLTGGAGLTPMPRNRPALPQCDIKLIELWVANGAQNN